jgi:hypothetical protein
LDFDLQPVKGAESIGCHEKATETQKSSGRAEPGKVEVGKSEYLNITGDFEHDFFI